MALTRKFLLALNIEPDKIDEIIEVYSNTVDALKDEKREFEEAARLLPQKEKALETVQKELDELKAATEKPGDSLYKKQYDDLKSEYDAYKKNQEAKEILSKKTDAYRSILKEIGVSEKRLESVLKVSDFDALELDNEGKIKNSDKLKSDLKEEWADFIVKEGQQGASTSMPPANKGGEPKRQSRAAMIAAQYHQNLYGSIPNKEGN